MKSLEEIANECALEAIGAFNSNDNTMSPESHAAVAKVILERLKALSEDSEGDIQGLSYSLDWREQERYHVIEALKEAGIDASGKFSKTHVHVANLVNLYKAAKNMEDAALEDVRQTISSVISELWAIAYPDNPTGWQYPGQVVNHLQIYVKHLQKERDELEGRIANALV